MSTPRLKLVFFTSKDCGTCKHVKANVLPLFKKEIPDLYIEEVQIVLDGKVKDRVAEARADAYGIQGVPAFRFELEGFPEGGAEVSALSALKKFVEAGRQALQRASEKAV